MCLIAEPLPCSGGEKAARVIGDRGEECPCDDSGKKMWWLSLCVSGAGLSDAHWLK